MLPIVSRIVRRFHAWRSHNTENKKISPRRHDAGRSTMQKDSEISYKLGFLIQKKKKLIKSGCRKHVANI